MKKETYEIILALVSLLSAIGGYWIIIDQAGLEVALGIFLIIFSLRAELKMRGAGYFSKGIGVKDERKKS